MQSLKKRDEFPANQFMMSNGPSSVSLKFITEQIWASWKHRLVVLTYYEYIQKVWVQAHNQYCNYKNRLCKLLHFLACTLKIGYRVPLYLQKQNKLGHTTQLT
jgi:hypothetical protein